MAGFAAARARKEKFKGLFGEDKAPIDLCTDPLQEARQKAKERALQKKKELERWRQELDEKHKQKIEILWPQKGDIYYFVELDKNLEPVIKSGRFKDPTEYKEGSNCFMTKEKANSYAREIIDMSEGDV